MFELPKDPGPELIASAIRMKGTTPTELARRNGLSDNGCRTALRRKYTAGELVIAEFLDLPLHHLWPDRWDPDGRRIDYRYSRQGNRRMLSGHRQNNAAINNTGRP